MRGGGKGEGDVKGKVAWLSGSDSVQHAQPLGESRMGRQQEKQQARRLCGLDRGQGRLMPESGAGAKVP